MIEPGTILQKRFVVGEQIGVGGMGAVYRAVDQKFGTDVAIKETLYSDPDLAKAFEREARLLNGLHHPLFPHVSDHFIEGNGHFLVMEYIEGEDLSALLKRGERFSFDTIVRWTLDLLDGLDYLHSQDPPIIHRDVKPSNLKLTPRGNLVLLDFGMAKETSGNTQGMRSVFGYSRRYSPLEQIEGTGTDVRSDIFSLGATVYHLATGTPPVDVLARASAIVGGKPDPLDIASDIESSLPEGFAALIHSALALDPGKRFVSARAMWNAVEIAMKDTPLVAATAPVAAPARTPLIENFDALRAFENDLAFKAAAAGDPQPRHGVVVPVNSEERANGEPEGVRKERIVPTTKARIIQRLKERPISSRLAASLAAMAILVLGLFGYEVYKRTVVPGGEVSSQQMADVAPIEPITEQTPSLEFATQSEPDAASTESKISEFGSDEATAEFPDENPAASAMTGRQIEAERTSTKKPIADRRDLMTRRAGNGTAVRPRVSRPISSREAPVSSIESVLTGMPDRTSQQRQWDIWREEQEELRRQRRLRRQIRQNRLRYPY